MQILAVCGLFFIVLSPLSCLSSVAILRHTRLLSFFLLIQIFFNSIFMILFFGVGLVVGEKTVKKVINYYHFMKFFDISVIIWQQSSL